MNRLQTTVRARGALSVADTQRMYALYAAYYVETTYDRFCIDLEAKDYVIELTDGKELRGFSTLSVIEFEANEGIRRAIYSGDTIIDHRYWGEQALATAFCRFAGSVKATDPGTPLYWFLITKGHRTYRYLSVFSKSYYPHHAHSTPAWAANYIDMLARHKFGSSWKPELGIVRFERSQGQLRAGWSEPRPSLAGRSEIRFFLECNPGHAGGDELCCITELCAANLRSYARRAFLEGYDDDSCVLSRDRGESAAVSQFVAPSALGPTGTPFLDTRG